jgi:hypothetical protein
VLPYRFALGARPFVAETTVAQQAALLVLPFVWIYHELAGIEGLVLFVRHLQFVFSLLVGAAVVAALRGTVRSLWTALLLGATAVAFVPFDIHSLSYNTLGGGLFTVGCVLAYLPLTQRASAGWLVGAGLCSGLAVFAYPSLVVAVVVAFGLRVLVAPTRWRTELLGFGVPTFLVAAATIGSVLAVAGFDAVVDGYHRSSRYLGHSGGAGKIADVLHHQWTTLHFWYLALPALALLLAAWRWRRPLAAPLLLALPLLLLPGSVYHSFDSPSYTATLEYVSHYGVLALPLALLVRHRPGVKALMLALWVPALVAGGATAYSSNNGGVNFGIGFLPATLVTTVFLLWALEDSLGSVRWSWAAALAPVLLVVLGGAVYRDGPISNLTWAVQSGAYAGIRTSPNKELFLEQFQRDLATIGSRCRIVFFRDFPAGYLLARSRPDTNSAWIATVDPTKTAAYQQTLIDYWARHGYPDVAVMVKRVPYDARKAARNEHYRTNTPLYALVHSARYRRLSEHYNYVTYARRGTDCGLTAGTAR